MVLHYAQMSFEGLKAYQTDSGEHVLFRPRENFKRMNRTSLRMCLPELDVEEVLTALKQLLRLDSGWVPNESGTSLYIRPTILATEEAIGLKVSSKYLFFIILSPVGPYYPQGFNPVKIMVSEKYVRAVPGGVGYAKTGGNYAASILAEKEAKELGYTQVLWLDAVERRYIEEVGSMNIFFLINEEIVTPQLTGSILPGITRISVLELGKHWGLKVSERRVSIDEILKGLKDGSVTEIFGSGTAAVISPVGVLSYKGEECQVGNGETGPITSRFYEELTGIQYGKVADPFDWVESI
jgi:branched-chain amino acid aminotransferase